MNLHRRDKVAAFLQLVFVVPYVAGLLIASAMFLSARIAWIIVPIAILSVVAATYGIIYFAFVVANRIEREMEGGDA